MSENFPKNPHADSTATPEGGSDLDNALLDAVIDEPPLEQTLADAIRHLLSQQGYPIDNVRLQ